MAACKKSFRVNGQGWGKSREITVRTATVNDAAALVEIYRPYVEKTAITFETEVPSVEEFAQRIAKTLVHYPYLVAEHAGKIIGYAYASAFYGRAAYAWTVETSVYVAHDEEGHGTGRVLYETLEAELQAMGVQCMLACLAMPTPDGIIVPQGSPAFHQQLGFQEVGHFHAVGYKLGRWHDVLWFEKSIGDLAQTGKAPQALHK